MNCLFRRRGVCCLLWTGSISIVLLCVFGRAPIPMLLLRDYDMAIRRSVVVRESIMERDDNKGTTNLNRTSQEAEHLRQESWGNNSAAKREDFFTDKSLTNRPFLALNFTSRERSYRFPSVEERLRIYLGDWYIPPCPNSFTSKVRYSWFQNKQEPNSSNATNNATTTLVLRWNSAHLGNEYHEQMIQVQRDIQPDNLFYLDRALIRDCYENPVYNIHQSCKDLADALLPVMDKYDFPLNEPPILLQFGDNSRSLNHGNVHVPHIRKRRRSMDRTILSVITDETSLTWCHDKPRLPALEVLQGIIWKLDFRRLYGNIPKVYHSDIAWSKKKNMAIFWGGPNGFQKISRDSGSSDLFLAAVNNNSSNKDNNNTTTSEREKCWAIPRCRFVYMYHNSSFITARLTTTRGKMANVIDGIPVAVPEGVNGRKSIQELLQYKALVMLEGNDVSSGLTWALFSNSVVMIPRPTFTSFAMEEVLEPYVHYVPLKSDLSNAEEQMQWILANDDTAQRIAQNGRRWIRDMFLHEDSQTDHDRINEEIIKRYLMHFVPATAKKGDVAVAASSAR